MKPTGKSIRENLARAKAAYAKNDEVRALRLVALSLKAFLSIKLFGPERTTVEGLFRELFALINKLDHVKVLAPKGIPYLKGQEPKLLSILIPLAKKVEEEINHETLEAMRQRKLHIDQCIMKGQKFLDEGNILEAQRNFRAAVDEYVDENGLFPLLASRLIDKGYHKQSLEYVKRAIDVSPDNARSYDFLMTALTGSKEWETGEKILREASKKYPDQPFILGHLAYVLAKSAKLDEAATFAEKALTYDPDQDMAKKVLALARKKQAQ